MQILEALEADLERELMKRGLAPVPNAQAFSHRGEVVRVEVGESVYRGPFVTVHDTTTRPRQFRGRDGAFEWDDIAACIVATAERRRADRLGAPRPAARAPAALPSSPFSIRPSASPGRMRVNLADMELDPVAAMQLYVLLRQAGAVA